ncbi:MAG: right-handed parallel beta-helix repeat-containing protein, partial [Candidatus Hodarchaeales archaeon]
MLQRRNNVQILFVLLLISAGGLIFRQSVIINEENLVIAKNLIKKSITKNFIVHTPITVNNDSDLAVFSSRGNGTFNSPYIITGWNITASQKDGIHITGTTKHFQINNCWIASSLAHGIFIENVTTGTVTLTNNTCINNNGDGINLWNSSSSILDNNNCSNNDKGIILQYSGSSILDNNTCNNNEKYGIYLSRSNLSNATSNICANNRQTGIYFILSSSSTVTNNMCSENNQRGLSLISSSSSTVSNNVCNINTKGIEVVESSFSTITDNFCLENNGEGISIDSSRYSLIKNNICSGNT